MTAYPTPAALETAHSWFESFTAALLRLDTRLFHLINRDGQARWLDAVMPVITNLHNIILHNRLYFWLAVCLLLLWAVRGRGRAIRAILGTALAVGMSDSFCTFIVKPIFRRPRPTSAHIHAILRTIRAISYSFPSNHAANSFSAAFAVSYFYPRTQIILVLYAAAVAYSRVYCGVHYPLDITAGALIGTFMGNFAPRLIDRTGNKIDELWAKWIYYRRRKKLAKHMTFEEQGNH